ncbi:MAG: hypothetical protein RL033_4789, partial [Pseudomonadota bacterium]
VDGAAGATGLEGLIEEPPVTEPVVCRTEDTCDPLECGPIANGCGDFIQCGGCEAPASCGGAGVPSHCGVPGSGGSSGGGGSSGVGCVATTCEDLGVTCGQHGDGCGGVVTCNPCGNGTECVQGQCQATTGCQLRTCEVDYPEAGRCGPVSDGCSGLLDCEFPSCDSNERCGAQEPGFCGVQTCEPYATCEEALQGRPAHYCGFVSDGCAGQMLGCAEVCSGGETCGVHSDGGTEPTCGTGGSSGPGCIADDQVTACAGKCGIVGDGCVSVYDCGNTCAQGELCGANGVANVCDAQECVAATCESLGAHCGQIDDGCGGTLFCPVCSNGDTCGGGGTPYECGSPVCVPPAEATACANANANCGLQSNGCSGTVNCGSCPNGQSCGGGGTPSQCGAPNVPPCVPDGTSCAELGWECGYAVNSCGDIYDCSEEGLSCNPFETCTGGISSPTTCEGSPVDCDVCDDVPSCSVSSPTRLSGRVITPGRADNNGPNQVGVPNAFVYILRTNDESALPTMDSGIPSGGTSCDRCEAQDLGPVLTSAVTDSLGNFTLSGNIPVNQDFLLITKVGKFRRAEIYNLPANAACVQTNLPTTLPGNPTRLPRTMSDGIAVNIPRMAISTGRIDAMECVFEKMGIASSQFSRPQLTGRIKLFRADGAWPDQQSQNCQNCGTATGNSGNGPTDTACRTANCGGSTTTARNNFLSAVNDSTLPASVASLSTYDMVVFDCEGQGWDSSFAQRNANGGNVREYVNRGGRMFASHLSMSWLNGNGSTAYSVATPLATGLGMAASWDTAYTNSSNLNTSGAGVVSVGRTAASPRIQSFADWMVNESVTTAPGYTFTITDPRSLAVADSLGASSEEFVYRSDGNQRVQQFSFNTPYGAPTADSCGRVAYSGFHVAATGGGTAPFQNSVFPNHCSGNLTSQEKILLFMLFDLGACVGDEPEAPTCDPLLVCPSNVDCGTIADGCGGLLQCGTCTAPDTCGGGGTPNQCGSSCTLTTCPAEGATCGIIGDGCGGTLNCGPCPQGTSCGAGGTPNVCGTPACTPRTCQSFGASCGSIGDGCGRTLNCGTCQSPAFCGGGGPNVCGNTTCTPTGCGTANCGTVGDGCGNAVSCGTCPQGSVCGAGGANKCGPVCTPRTCLQAGKNCGFIGDGCGGVLDCGTCSEGVICGGGGTANVCGGSCNLATCGSANANCGTLGDNCGGVLSCGTCPSGQVCGAQAANQCGTGTCTPTTCGARCGIQSNGCSGTLDCGPCNGCVPFQCQALVDCGPVADGCGDLINCGGCANGNTCGGGGYASKCGGGIQ